MIRRALPLFALVLTAVACADDSPATSSSSVPTAELAVVDGQPFPAARCEANRAAGAITYLSSFDFAATASIVDVLVADAKGYYDELCLDVELKPSFSVENYPLIAADDAQFSSGGSFSEMVNFAGTNDAGFVAVLVEGRTGIDALITKDGAIDSLADLRGTIIGVKGAITPSVKAMLADAGLVEGTDYTTVLLEGFDPKVHIEVPSIVGFPGYKSNEPLQLEAAGTPFQLWDPAEHGIPGSFGVLYTSQQFIDDHPTAAEDFVRATLRGLADAVADPSAAAAIAVEAINGNGNQMYLSADSETARWKVESQLVTDGVTADRPLGVPVLELLTAEVRAYAAIGLFDGVEPSLDGLADLSLAAGLYTSDQRVIWPG